MLFFLFYDHFPSADDLSFCKIKINEGFKEGINIVSNTKLHSELSPMLVFQALVLQIKTNMYTNPFVIVGIVFAFVISIINKRLQNPTSLSLDTSRGLIQNFQRLINFPEDVLFEKMMIAWMDAGNTPSAMDTGALYNNLRQLTTIDNFLELVPLFTALSRTTGLISYSFMNRKGSPVITKEVSC